MSRWISVDITPSDPDVDWLKVLDRIRGFFYRRSRRDEGLKEIYGAVRLAASEARRLYRATGVARLRLAEPIGRNQTLRMALLELLGRPEDALLLSSREDLLLARIVGLFEEHGLPVTVGGRPVTREGLEARAEAVQNAVREYKVLLREFKSGEYRRIYVEAVRQAVGQRFGDHVAKAVYNGLRELTAKLPVIAVYEDEGYIPALGVKVAFRRGEVYPDVESGAELVYRRLVEAIELEAKARAEDNKELLEEAELVRSELDTLKVFWAEAYGDRFAEEAFRNGYMAAEADRDYVLDCPRWVKDYVESRRMEFEGGVLLGPGNVVVYEGTEQAKKVKLAAILSGTWRRVPPQSLSEYGRVYDPPGLDDALEVLRRFAHCPSGRRALSILERAAEVRRTHLSSVATA